MLIASSCVDHPVGPARTYDSYAAKASTTASSALSAVETVRLLATTAADGNAFAPYTSVAVSEQEDTLGGVQGTFASIQPPDKRSEELRDELGAILASSFDHVSAVRIEARRGHLDRLAAVAAPLEQDAADLRAIEDELA